MAISIPLSVIASLLVLTALGETINIMTLGGLALAVGILVDDATVTIENIDRNLEEGKRGERPFSTAPRRSRSRHWFRPLRSASCSCRCFPERGGAVPVRAAGRSGGVRDAGVVHPVANPGADAGQVPAEGARAGRA